MLIRLASIAALAWLWLGLLLGVSFLATPVKFTVADLALSNALQVGAATFGLFSKVEWGLAVVLLSACAAAPERRVLLLGVAVALAAAVFTQAVWLLPALDARVAEIVAGRAPPSSPHHHVYAGLAAAKAVLLGSLGIGALALMCVASKLESTPTHSGAKATKSP